MNEYKIFMNWLFDDNYHNSEIPNPELLLKYNSPITHTYLISLFVKCGKLNHYLDEYMNNINLRYINKKELMFYIKKCIIENKIKKYQINYFIYKRRDKLFNTLKERIPYLKNEDISLLCEQIDRSDEKESIYQTFGIVIPKKQKIKKIKKKVNISLKDFIKNNFSIVTVEES